jgi:hypothetical protein
MATMRGDHARVIFDNLAFREDLRHTSINGRAVARAARDTCERDGCAIDDLLACESEAVDGTKLPRCVKVYLPRPSGRFGMVFEINRRSRRLVLAYLAFGARHHPRGSHTPTVYQLAHRRLHCRGRLPS